MRVMPDGTSRVIAVRICRTKEFGAVPPFINPLEGMSDEMIYGLRGVAIDCPEAPIADRLMRINPERTLVACRADVVSLPPMPEGLRYLFADFSDCRFGWHRFDFLPRLKKLRFLLIAGLRWDFNAAWLSECPELSYLDLSCAIQHVEAIGRLSRLRHLGIYRHDVGDLAWIRGLTLLRQLDVEWPVKNLSALENLAELKRLQVGGIERELSEEDALRALARRHPSCHVVIGGPAVLAGSTRIWIRSGGLCHRDVSEEKTLAEESDPDTIRQVVDRIRFAPRDGKNLRQCRCCGEPSLEFYRDFEWITTLAMHHGNALRGDRWIEGGDLSPTSGDFLCDWLARKGVGGPQEELLRNREAEKKSPR
jgi:hypothetical protein